MVNDLSLEVSAREQLVRDTFHLQLSLVWISQRHVMRVLEDHHLLPPHQMVLELLAGEHPSLVKPGDQGLTMSEIARALSMPMASNSQIADRLVALELAERLPDPHDRRVNRIRLTAKGSELLKGLQEKWLELHRDLLSSLSDDELVMFKQVLERLYSRYTVKDA